MHISKILDSPVTSTLIGMSFAFGMDRLTAILAGEENIREVIAYPKTQSGADPLTSAPTPIDSRHLEELGLRVLPPSE